AGRARRTRDLSGQREFLELWQGPRRYPPARTVARGPGRGRWAVLDSGFVPPAGRGSAEPDRGDGEHAEGRSLLRSVISTRGARGAAKNAPFRWRRVVLGIDRHHSPAGAGGRHPEQCDLRLSGRDRGRCRGTVPVFGRRGIGCDRGLRLLLGGGYGGMPAGWAASARG